MTQMKMEWVTPAITVQQYLMQIKSIQMRTAEEMSVIIVQICQY